MTENTKKAKKTYNCICCDFSTSKKTDYERHLDSRKHKRMTEKDENDNKKYEKNDTHICIHCKKVYSSRQALWKHNKICKSAVKNESHSTATATSTATPTDISNNSIAITGEMILEMFKTNQEFHNNVLQELKSIIIELAQVNHIVSTNNTTNNNTTNNNTTNNTINATTNNQSFNLNFFLNETCKDAKNWSDFLKDIVITQEHLIRDGPLGFIKIMIKTLAENLSKFSETERPIHCSDAKRNTFYIKEENEWDNEKSEERFENGLHYISDKYKTAYLVAQEEEPDMSVEKQNTLMLCCRNIMMTGEHIAKIQKIKTEILRTVTIDKSIKNY